MTASPHHDGHHHHHSCRFKSDQRFLGGSKRHGVMSMVMVLGRSWGDGSGCRGVMGLVDMGSATWLSC
eukprot:10979214-Alexandrium_andersonii.AAC.1